MLGHSLFGSQTIQGIFLPYHLMLIADIDLWVSFTKYIGNILLVLNYLDIIYATDYHHSSSRHLLFLPLDTSEIFIRVTQAPLCTFYPNA